MNPTDEQELDPIINIMDMWDFSPFQDEDIRRERVYKEVQAHTNAEIAKVLDKIMWAYKNPLEGTGYLSIEHVIEAERAKLKEVV